MDFFTIKPNEAHVQIELVQEIDSMRVLTIEECVAAAGGGFIPGIGSFV
jgi:hypothetical protein